MSRFGGITTVGLMAVVGVAVIRRGGGGGWDKDALVELFRGLKEKLGFWAIPVYVLIHTLTLALCLPYAVFFEAGASLLFGFFPAVACVFSAKILGASLSFWVGRYFEGMTFSARIKEDVLILRRLKYGRKELGLLQSEWSIQQICLTSRYKFDYFGFFRAIFRSSRAAMEWAQRNKYFLLLSRGLERDGWRFVLLARFSPLPSYVINYALAATKVRFLIDFLLPTVVGCLPMILQNTSIGSLAGAAVSSASGSQKSQKVTFLMK
ncbi:hypothetical protein ACLOJK_015881 [Asimina triloba]